MSICLVFVALIALANLRGVRESGALRRKWEQWGSGIELVALPSPYRELTRPLPGYIDRLRRKGDENFVTVVLPEFVPVRSWQQLLHNQNSLLLKGSLFFKKGVIVTSVPYHLER